MGAAGGSCGGELVSCVSLAWACGSLLSLRSTAVICDGEGEGEGEDAPLSSGESEAGELAMWGLGWGCGATAAGPRVVMLAMLLV